MTKQYRPEGEGAIYSRSRVATAEDSERIRKENERALAGYRSDPVEEARELALEVLRHFYGDEVEIGGALQQPTIDGEPIPWPGINEQPEIASDAFWLIDQAGGVETFRRTVCDPRFADCKPPEELTLAAFHMGRMMERVAIRWEGFEAQVASRKRSVAALPKGRPKIEIGSALLRDEWERACRMRPNADKHALRTIVADRLGTSPATIKRRLSEYGIDPPAENLEK